MKLDVGSIQLSISRKSSSQTPALTITGSSGVSPLIFNRYDNPQQNLLLIRETVSAAMHARSEAIGRGKLHGYELRTNERTPLRVDHGLEKLLQAPNPLMNGTDLLELVSQWLDATGNALLLKVRNGFGTPSELWLLPATSYIIERGADQLPQFYKFFPSNTSISASDVIHIKRSDIRTAPFNGHAILSDIIETAKTDSALRLYQQRFFDNDAMPRSVMQFPAGTTLTQSQLDDIRATWESKYQGATNAGKLAILPDGGTLESLGGSTKELDFAASRSALRDSIREAFKVPKIVLGDTNEVNLSNADTSYRVFMRDVIDHALGKIAAALTRGLATEFSPSIVIEHDDIIPESEEKLIRRLQELKQSLSIDEQRKMLGLPPLPSGKGKGFIVGTTVYDANWKVIV